MKEKYIIVLILIFIIILTIKPIINYTSDIFWNFVESQLDNEESERLKKAENGEISKGKDTILIWKNMYVIGHFSDGNHLSIETKETNETILKNVVTHKKKNGKLYIVSDEGYAVIDKNNLCRVFITIDDEKFVNGYSEDSNGNRTYISRKVECENIVYLSKYDEFSTEEKKILGIE